MVTRQKNSGDWTKFYFLAKVIDIRQAVTFGKNFQKCLVFLARPAVYKKFGHNYGPGYDGKHQKQQEDTFGYRGGTGNHF